MTDAFIEGAQESKSWWQKAAASRLQATVVLWVTDTVQWTDKLRQARHGAVNRRTKYCCGIVTVIVTKTAACKSVPPSLAALHLNRIKLGTKLIQSLHPL